MIRKHIFLTGMVQGVGFRGWVEAQAIEIGVKGWVRNIRDQKVEILVEGEDEKVKQFIEVLKVGNGGSRIDKIETINELYSGEFKEFNIVF